MNKLLIKIVLLFTLSLLGFSHANAAENCGNEFYVNEIFPNGARWDMCWEHKDREGIIFKSIYFTPKNGTRRMVLNQAAIAQIHVPYDDNGTRFHDLSDLGIGGLNMLELQSDECLDGSLIPFSGKNVLCKQTTKQDISFKSGTNTANGYYLSLFSVSPVGAYYYIPTWKFFDNGKIEPWMGATGALQRFGTDDSTGWLLADNRVGIAHLHNFFWKLDFDLNKTYLDDAVEEINFNLVNGKRERSIIPFSTEAARKVNPETMRHWRVRDKSAKNENGHSISYDVILSEMGHQDIGPASEPFTHNDFFVTTQNDNERFASHNTSGGANLDEFVNGESIVDNDIVVWAGVTFYHMPRSEDAPHMDAHWSHLKIVPRDWNASNTLSDDVTNNAPTIATVANQNSQISDSITLNIQASDSDGDSLTYNVSNLPTGLSINTSSGVISGVISTAGTYLVQITVSDGQQSASTQFNWVVSAASTGSSSGGGTLSIMLLFSLLGLILFNVFFRFKNND
ncbi:putative Ig domain-containing protein [Cocleimonas sp. KMM 6892]|uniref:copper amine oxidase n=1 Tax=unclassified Cocleimonas TaxID=2639732 RepID=UPI002DB67DB1|nr:MULTISPECIES: putative Ig domain-containing protein [unclassified Cocleimonas]MEB8431348.1 putative Ig domain-containing protein [Cocleimonas sp. KMM 6892]MEC4713880.1 putative Ig domain-containing protein [Cocleimonas sp. KMM 6895]MEC4743211.1 putative Ig domain-containing protein [Cocleimonas sp. KMM 6896]